MKKGTINSILLNILWSIISLLPIIILLLFYAQGSRTGTNTYTLVQMNSSLWLYLGFERINTSSFLYTFLQSFLNLFGAYSVRLCTLLLWIVYVQFVRIIFNLAFFLFDLCHKYLECFDKDNENNLL